MESSAPHTLGQARNTNGLATATVAEASQPGQCWLATTSPRLTLDTENARELRDALNRFLDQADA